MSLSKRERGRRAASRRARILDRDGYRCRDCGRPGRLEVHHVDGDAMNDADDNLRTLCRTCHLAAHRKPEDEAWRAMVAELFGG